MPMPKAQGLKIKSVHRTQTRHGGEGEEQVTFGDGQGGEIAIKKTGPEPRGEIWETKAQMKAEREVDSWTLMVSGSREAGKKQEGGNESQNE